MAETFDRAAVLDRLVEHHCTSVNWRDGVAYTYCPSCGEPGCDLAATLAALDAATARVRVLEAQVRKDHHVAESHTDRFLCAVCIEDGGGYPVAQQWPCAVLTTLALAPATGEESAATVAALTQTGGSDAV